MPKAVSDFIDGIGSGYVICFILEENIHLIGLIDLVGSDNNISHLPSNAYRMVPHRFEVFPSELTKQTPTSPALIDRVQPFRFKLRKAGSFQVVNVETRHLENIMITKHLHYVVESDERRFFILCLSWTKWIGGSCRKWMNSTYSLVS